MRVSLDTASCAGEGKCVAVCPQVFAMDDDDKAFVLDKHPEPTLRERVRTAQKICPRAAISIDS